MDNEELTPGTPIWEAEIEGAIAGAGAAVVLLSPKAKKSEWVRAEIEYAKMHQKRVYPVLVAGGCADLGAVGAVVPPVR